MPETPERRRVARLTVPFTSRGLAQSSASCENQLPFATGKGLPEALTDKGGRGEEVREVVDVVERPAEVHGGELRFIQIAAGGGIVYGLGSDGRVYEFSAVKGGWIVLPMKQS